MTHHLFLYLSDLLPPKILADFRPDIWRARVCRPLLRLCRPFIIFEGCLDSTQITTVESWRATDLATHPPRLNHLSP
jgi:hypothetical protein